MQGHECSASYTAIGPSERRVRLVPVDVLVVTVNKQPGAEPEYKRPADESSSEKLSSRKSTTIDGRIYPGWALYVAMVSPCVENRAKGRRMKGEGGMPFGYIPGLKRKTEVHYTNYYSGVKDSSRISSSAF